MEWKKLPVPLSELCLSSVLRCGQSFRWKSSGSDEWSCALSGRILSLKQDPTHLYYRAIFPSSSTVVKKEEGIKKEHDIKHESDVAVDDTVELIRDYFNLSVNLTELYEKWSSCDPHFKKKAPTFIGIRMLRQDPWENLVSFICSSNNNISRIGQMVENLCKTFGVPLGRLGDTPYYDFPSPSKLTPASVEGKLRDLGFGYRAKYIHQTAQIVAARGEDWLHGLRHVPYREAHESLIELQGVGPKVADCVCLMSLDKKESVPVDTHVWQIAMRDYKFGKGKHKSLTKATYLAIGDHFRDLWGEEAGWAHSVLFAADLKAFAVKEVKIENPTIITVKRGVKDEESDSSSNDEDASSANITTKKISRKIKVKAKNEDETDAENSVREVKLEIRVKDGGTGVDETNMETTDTTNKFKSEDDQVAGVGTARRGWKGVEVEIKNGDQTIENTSTVAKRYSRRKLKVELKEEDDVEGDEGADEEEEGGIYVKKEKGVKMGKGIQKEKAVAKKERVLVKKEKVVKIEKEGGKSDSSAKRALEAEKGEQLLIKAEDLDSGLTMADRIKRRRRR